MLRILIYVGDTMIEIYLLEQLKAFQEQGTLSRAAEKLHMTQPSLTRSIQKIESVLDAKILDRQGNRVSLNDTGKIVADYANRILDLENEMVRAVKALEKAKSSLVVGSIAPGPTYLLIPQAIASFPELSVTYESGDEESLISGLDSNEFGLIILTHPLSDERYISKRYISEQLYLSVSNMHPAATYKEVSFSDVDGQNFIMYSQVGLWDEIVVGEMPHSKFFRQTTYEAIGELTNRSELPSFASSITVNNMRAYFKNRTFIPFKDESATVTFYIICNRETYKKYKALFDIPTQDFPIPIK